MNGKSELKAALNAIDMVRDNYPSVPWADGDDTVVADRVGRATASGHRNSESTISNTLHEG